MSLQIAFELPPDALATREVDGDRTVLRNEGRQGGEPNRFVDANEDAVRDVRLDADTGRQAAWLHGAGAVLGAFAGKPLTELDHACWRLRQLADPDRFDGASFERSTRSPGVEALGYVGDDADVDHLRWLGDLETTYDSTAVGARTAIDRMTDYPLGHW